MIPAGHGRLLRQQVAAPGVHQNSGGGGAAHDGADVGIPQHLGIGRRGIVHRRGGQPAGEPVFVGETAGCRQQTQGRDARSAFPPQDAAQLQRCSGAALCHGEGVGLYRGAAAFGLRKAGPADIGRPDAPAEPLRPFAGFVPDPALGLGNAAHGKVGVPAEHHSGKGPHGHLRRGEGAFGLLRRQRQCAPSDGGILLQGADRSGAEGGKLGEQDQIIHCDHRFSIRIIS